MLMQQFSGKLFIPIFMLDFFIAQQLNQRHENGRTKVCLRLRICPIFIHQEACQRPRGNHRVGPHNKDVLCFLFGSLLGDSCAEYRTGSTRFHFRQSFTQQNYLLWKHAFLSERGYCPLKNPKVRWTRSNLMVGPVGKLEFRTFSYPSLNFMYDFFYQVDSFSFENKQILNKKVKKVPSTEHLNTYLNPLALAIWAMDDGYKYGSGFCFATESFSHPDLIRLQVFLKQTYNLETTLRTRAREKDQYRLYILKKSMNLFKALVLPYWHPHFIYKIPNSLGEKTYMFPYFNSVK